MINLLPPKRVLGIKVARNNTILRRYLELSIMAMLILCATVFAAHYFIHLQNVHTQTAVTLGEVKIKELEPVNKKAEELSKTVNIIDSLISRNIKFSELLVKLGAVMPDGSVLTGLQFSVDSLDSPLVISAQINDEQKAAILRNNLAGSDLFERVEIKNITLNEASSGTASSTTTPATPVIQQPGLTTTSAAGETSQYRYTAKLDAYFKTGVLEPKKL
jgi:Tfp pilus assembly protein PilN